MPKNNITITVMDVTKG